MAENTQHHGYFPSELLQNRAENKHRQDFRDLPDAHDGHNPPRFKTPAQKAARRREVTVMNRSINERHNEQNEDIRDAQKTDRFDPGKIIRFGRGRFWRRMGQRQRVRGQRERSNAGNNENIFVKRNGFGASFVANPEKQWPGRKNPTNRPPRSHRPKLPLWIFQIREGERIRDGDGWHVNQRVNQQKAKEWPEIFYEVQSENRNAADQMAGGKKFFGREAPVCKFVTEE